VILYVRLSNVDHFIRNHASSIWSSDFNSNFGLARKDIPRYRVPAQAKEGAAKEITIPEFKADGKYEL
jgi:hypothetical protein